MVRPKIKTTLTNIVNRMAESCKLNCPKLPTARKCCFCVPVRKGIIIFGYVCLVIELLSFSLLLLLLTVHVEREKDEPQEKDTDVTQKDTLVDLSLTTVLNGIDLVMTIVLLIGTHKNKKSLLKIYLYFGVVFQLLTLWVDLHYFDYREYIENCIYFIGVSLNIYLLYMVYSMTNAFEEYTQVHYVEYRDNSQQNF